MRNVQPLIWTFLQEPSMSMSVAVHIRELSCPLNQSGTGHQLWKTYPSKLIILLVTQA